MQKSSPVPFRSRITSYNVCYTKLLRVNGENAAGGLAITPEVAREIFKVGADVITTGNHVWNNREILNRLDNEQRLLRPHNYPPGVPGNGVYVVNCKGVSVCVVNLIGRVMMNPVDCPFRGFDDIYEMYRDKADCRITSYNVCYMKLLRNFNITCFNAQGNIS